MNRLHFLRTMMPAGLSVVLAGKGFAAFHPPDFTPGPAPIPPFLKPGDLVGITCPASPVALSETVACTEILKQWGFDYCVGNTVGRKWERFGGSDGERAADLQQLINDPQVKAILFGRGGYGVMRMMDLVDWRPLLEHPKWLIGFSDITAIHCHVNRQLGLPTLHANMAGSINDPESPANKSLWQALRGDRMQYIAEGHPLNRSGIGTGMLVGGNLSLINATLGSPSELQTDGRLLLIEDVSEYKYTIDRLLMTLKRAGKLNKLAGLLVGGFTATKEENEPGFPMTVEDIILEKVKEFHYPVAFNFPAGHIKNNLAIKLGVHYNLYTAYSGSALSEVQDPHPPLPSPPNAPRP